MILKRLTGMLDSNCYILGSKGEGAVIDPGTSVENIEGVLKDENLDLKYIILTHAHFDHMCSLEELRSKKADAKLIIHESEAEALANPAKNSSLMFGTKQSYKPADILVKDGDTMALDDENLEFIHTPGHTSGGMCIKVGNYVFTGDTLFRLSIGRSDLGDGDGRLLIKSIKEKLMSLDENLTVFPGHGPESTIGFEKANNFFL
jgi:hydroxyacylglutathione hydrolase